MKRRVGIVAIVCGGVLAAIAAGCGGGSEPAAQEEAAPPAATEAAAATETGAPEPTTEAEAGPDLRAACGDRIVVQTDWYPAGNHSAVYQLAGPGGEVDAKKGRYTNEIGSTGVLLEIRAGGPFIGFQGDVSIIYQNTDITLGYVNTAEAAQFSKSNPVVGVVTPYDKNPQALMWNPEALEINSFEDIGKSGAPVLVFDPSASWVEYLIGKGWLSREQVDGSYDGSPSRFVAEDGAIVQQVFATDEVPYYENVLEQWKKPVGYLLLHDSGLEDYPQVLSARPEVVEEKRECFKLLVPMIQQAQVDWANDPGPTNELLSELQDAYKAPIVQTPELLQDHRDLALEEGIISNGSDSTLGNFDTARVQGVIDLVLPIFGKQGLDTFDSDVTPEQIATNEFIDPSIGLSQ